MRDMKVISRKNREYLEKHNPCFQEEGSSRKCLEKNNYDQEKCNIYFLNVRNCKDFWEMVKYERKMKGIKPYLPLPNERAKIKAAHLKNSSEYPSVLPSE